MASAEITTRARRGPLPQLARFAIQAAESAAEFYGSIFKLFMFGRVRRREPEPDQNVLDDHSHLIRLFRSALGDNSDQLISILNSFTQNSDRIQRALVVWLDLVEVLVQDAERRYGQAPGQGKIKAAEVKQALSYILRSRRFSLPNLPEPLMTLAMDTVVDWAIDLVVLQANRYDLWEVKEVRMTLMRRIWITISKLMKSIGIKILNLGARIVIWIRQLIRPLPVLSPALKAALEAVEREGEIKDEKSLVVRVSKLFIWLGTHRSDVIQASELVFGAVQEAERLITMTGPEKKEFARDLIWEVLEEMGFIPRYGIVEVLIDSAIDLLIETSVHFFNKRGAFESDHPRPIPVHV